jgi:CheY-like chemotaxis protein
VGVLGDIRDREIRHDVAPGERREGRRDQRELGRQAGATAWVLKPVKPATLLNAIQRVLPGP